jgi:hypothetical protein
MTYFLDLSDYEYIQECIRPNTLNIGWLSEEQDFEKEAPSESDLDLIWAACKISVAKTRGLHRCEFCSGTESLVSIRKESNLLLGDAEIRVFASDGKIYAAPNLIFHYMSVHHYVPPSEFLHSLRNGIKPLTEQYFSRLKELRLEYTISPEGNPSVKSFRLSDLPE